MQICELVCDKCNHMWAFHENGYCIMSVAFGSQIEICGCHPSFLIPGSVAYERFVYSIVEEQKRKIGAANA